MALPMHDDLPMPPELATEAPPIPDAELAQLFDEAAALAADAGLNAEAAAEAVVESEDAPSWHITGLGTAEWAMRHAAGAERALGELQAQRAEWAARIDRWFQQAAAREQARLAFFRGHLEAWALDERERTGGRTKSVTLPSGRVATTAHKAKVVVADEQAVVEWADATLGLDAQDVAPVVRKVYVNPLREHVEMVEVIDHARLVLASGELVAWLRDGSVPDGEVVPSDVAVGSTCPAVGDGWPSPDDATDLVARVEVIASHREVRGPNGQPVPGVAIEAERVTAKVVPGDFTDQHAEYRQAAQEHQAGRQLDEAQRAGYGGDL